MNSATIANLLLSITLSLSNFAFLANHSPSRKTPVRAAPVKRALLVGVSQYDRGRGSDQDWWNLHSERDVDAIATILKDKERFGFDEVKVLKSREETTHQAIVTAFRDFLIKKTNPGDIVYFHYSGHGSQVPDSNSPDNPIVGDEVIDHLDECMVPSDYISINDGRNNIRDDEFADLLNQLSQKSPSNVTLSFDSCFAGTISRGKKGRHLNRGRLWTGPVPAAAAAAAPPPAQPASNNPQAKELGRFLPDGLAKKLGFVFLGATRSNQLASETDDANGNEMGLFTYSLINALLASGRQTTYRDIFERINEEMMQRTSTQNPQLEGAIDNVLMSGTVSPPQPYFNVNVLDQSIIQLQAGELQGVTAGSRFAIYPAGTRDFKNAKPKAEAIVSDPQLNNSVLELTPESKAGGAKVEDLQAGRAVEIRHEYGDNRLTLDLRLVQAQEGSAALVNQIKALPLVNNDNSVDERWDVRLCPGQCPDEVEKLNLPSSTITLQGQDGAILRRVAADSAQLNKIRQALEAQARWVFINKLENQGPEAKVKIDFRLVPVEVETQGPCGDVTKWVRDKEAEVKSDSGGRIKLARCNYVRLEVKNEGEKDAYVTILDLMNDGRLNPLWPDPFQKVQENRIPPDGQWTKIPYPEYIIRIDKDEPLGVEIFKAIATSEPADFSPLLIRQLGRGPRSEREKNAFQNPLGQFLKAITTGQRASKAGLNPSDWATKAILFEVVDQ